MVAASALLAMIGCSKDWPFERTENGKVEIEGGGDPDAPPPVYPAVVYGTIYYWVDYPTSANIYIYDANRTCICSTAIGPINDEPRSFNTCACNTSTESELPWYVCGECYYNGNWYHDEDTIYSLPGQYTCGQIQRKAPGLGGVVLYLYDIGRCQTCGY